MLFIFGLLPVASTAPHTLTVEVSSTVARGGIIHLAVYENAEQFQEEASTIGYALECTFGRATFSVELPATGRYALAAYHDVNGNGKLDKNLWGIPTEPYGFSQVPETKWRAPTFAEISRHFEPRVTTAKMSLKRWKEY